MRAMRVVMLVLVAMAVPVVLGFDWKGRGGDIEQFDKIVHVVTKAYEGASNPESAIVMAELAIFDSGKKGMIEDAPARLEKALAQQTAQGIRNFTRFLIAGSYMEKKDAKRAADELSALIAENAAHVGGSQPK